MKRSYVILIFLANIVFRSSAQFTRNDEERDVLLFLISAGLLVFSVRFGKRIVINIDNGEGTRSTTQAPLCRTGYTFYSGPGRNFCYRIASECKTWDDARSVCQTEGADLAVLDNDSLKPFGAIVKRDFPTGLNCINQKAAWIGAKTLNIRPTAGYIDGTEIPVGIDFWALGEPTTAENCIYIGFLGPKEFIADDRCSIDLSSYVCQQF